MRLVNILIAVLIVSLFFMGIVLAHPKSDNFKTLLSEKQMSSNEDEEPYFTIARDKASYESLRKKHPKLPAASEINFKTHAVVAVYSQLPTPCHGLAFRKSGKTIYVSVKSPEKDVMCAQVISYVIEIKLVPVKKGETLKVVLPGK